MTTQCKIGNKYKVYTKNSDVVMFEGYLLYEVDSYLYLGENKDTVINDCIPYDNDYYKLKEVVEDKGKTKLEEYVEKYEELQKLRTDAIQTLEDTASNLYQEITVIRRVDNALETFLIGTVCIDFVLDAGKFETVFKDTDGETWLITPEQFEQWKTICLNWKALNPS